MEDRILIQCDDADQAKMVYKFLMNKLLECGAVGCITANEKPGATSDPDAYFIELEKP